MVESAYRLIAGEAGNPAEQMPSAHRASLGQRLRTANFRFLLKPSTMARLSRIPVGQAVRLDLNEYLLKGARRTYLATVHSIGEGAEAWIDTAVPNDQPFAGFAVRVENLPGGLASVDDAKAFLQGLGLDEVDSAIAGPQRCRAACDGRHGCCVLVRGRST